VFLVLRSLVLQTVVIAITIAIVQEYKSDQSLDALAKLTPPRCHVLRGGDVVEEEAAGLVPGDIIVLAAGDRIPADIRLLEAVDLLVDESSLTGENDPSRKITAALQSPAADVTRVTPQRSAGRAISAFAVSAPAATTAPTHLPVAERKNCGFMGSLVSSGRGRAVVIATGMATELGHIFGMLDQTKLRKSPLQSRMDELGQRLSAISFAIIVLIVFHGVVFRGKTLLDMFGIGVSLAVASIPEGLPIVVAVTLALGVQVRASTFHF
jgi:P-type Ca2+ transporter type 2C